MTASPINTKKKDAQPVINELEQMLHSKIITTSDPSLLAFAYKPRDEVWTYDGPGYEMGTQLYQDVLRVKTLIPEIAFNFELALRASVALGTWFTDQVIGYVIGRTPAESYLLIPMFERSKAYAEMSSLEDKEAGIQELNAIAERVHHHHFQPLQPRLPQMSAKVQKLYQNLKAAFLRNPQTRAMVFVQQRWTVASLHDAFQTLNIPGVRVGMLTGAGGRFGHVKFSTLKQEEALSHFRTGLVNVLFTTSVAEEGLDIPQCNLVVRFDLYTKTIEYIQSRGRARMADSVYVHMIQEGDFKAKSDMDFVMRQDEYIKAYCQQLPSDRLLGRGTKLAQLIARDSANQSFRTASGVICNFTNSLVILSRFASSLHHVGATIHEVYEEVVDDVIQGHFQYIVRLPPSEQCRVKGARGDPRLNKQLAKRSAAYWCVCRLRAAELLDENLDSVFVKVKPENLNAHLAVSGKKDNYDMKIKPEFWNEGLGKSPTKLFATTLEIHTDAPLENPLAPMVLFTRIPLPQIPRFPVFLEDDVEGKVILTNLGEYSVSEQHLQALTSFTLNAVFYDVFNKVYENDTTQMGYWLVPRAGQTNSLPNQITDFVDFGALKASMVARIEWSPGMEPLAWSEKFLVDPLSGKYRYFSKSIVPGVGPFDAEPEHFLAGGGKKSKATSIIYFTDSHYRVKQKDTLALNWDRKQPVLHAEIQTIRRNFLDRPTDKEKIRDFCLIAPQPLEIARLMPSAARSSLAWPAILHRIESYLIALEAMDKMNLRGVPADLALQAFTKDDSVDDQEYQTHGGKARGMGKNYERLEFIGDSLLKMTSTIAIYNRTTCDEEGMHCRRMEVLCNRTLYNTATGSLELPQYIRTTSFMRDTWYPENLVLRQGRGAQEGPVRHPARQHQLGMKTIADVCEATIGACVVASEHLPIPARFDLAICAVTRLVQSEDHNVQCWADFSKMHQLPRWSLDQTDPIANYLASNIATKIGYTFNHPRLIRSAFTHSSDTTAHVPDLQRLEFLGDAVLDWVCIWWLFTTNPNRNPQWLTEHKMAMVSNKFLAALAVVLDFDKLFSIKTSSLASDIFTYATEVREARAQEDCPIDFWTTINAKPPKALSDLVESTIGAILIDSDFDYSHIEDFFYRHVHPFFVDISKYDGFASRHPTSYITKKLSDEYGCTDFRVLSTDVEEGRIETIITAGVVVHNTTLAWSQGESARYARVRASQKALQILEGMSRDEFRARFRCDCARGKRLEEEGVVVNGVRTAGESGMMQEMENSEEKTAMKEDAVGDIDNFEQDRVRYSLDEYL